MLRTKSISNDVADHLANEMIPVSPVKLCSPPCELQRISSALRVNRGAECFITPLMLSRL